MKTFKSWSKFFRVLVPLLFMIGCGGGGGGGTGQLKLSLTDAATDQYNAVYVTIDRIDVHGSDMDEESWQTLPNFTFPRTINLLDLTNGVREELGIATLAAGHYTQMRLHLRKEPQPGHINILSQLSTLGNYVIDINNEIHELKIPSGFQTGIKIVGGFDINANETTELILDFDASASVVVAGKSGQYLLKPTIKILETTDFAILSGTVTHGLGGPPIAGAMVSAQIPTTDPQGPLIVETATVTDGAGFYKLFIRPGTYNIVVYKNGFGPAVQNLTLIAGATLIQDFVLATTTTGTVSEQVTIQLPPDPNIFATTSFRLPAPAPSADIIEMFSINIADGSTVVFTLNSGTYTAASSTFGRADQFATVVVGDGTNTDMKVNF